MVKSLKLVISNCVIIDLAELQELEHGPIIQKGIEKLVTYKNPKYQEALKWGYSVFNIPSHLYSYEYSDDNKSMYLSRGTQTRVINYLKTFGIEAFIIDNTLVSPMVDFNQSKTIMRPDQALAITDLIRRGPQGILIAFTSFGKSLTMLELARQLRQVMTIVVHTTFLQEQWIKEATNPDTFNLPIEKIGGVGGIFGGKRKLGQINVCLYHSLSKDVHLNFFAPHTGLVISDEVQKSPIDDIQKVVNMFPARYRFGCSARIERKDHKEFLTLDTFGDVLHTAIEKDGDSKIISSITIIPTGYTDNIPTPEDPDKLKPKEQDSHTGMLTRMASDKERNITICKIAISRIRQGKLVIIFVERKEQAGYLMKMLSKFKGDMLIGATNKEAVNELDCPQSVKDILNSFDHEGAYDRIVNAAEKKDLNFVIGTQKAEVGLSIRTLDVGLVTTPVGNNPERFNQIKGRIERTYSDEQQNFFGHKKLKPELIVLKDKIKSSRNSASAIKELYGDIVREVKIKQNSDNKNVIIRRKQ